MLEFQLGEYPIKVHFSFLLLAVIVLDAGFGAAGLLIWTGVAFLSILLHELAHAYFVRRQGAILEHVMIYAMGGLTYWRESLSTTIRWTDRILISAAGPLSGIIVGLAAFAAIRTGWVGELPQALVTEPWNPWLQVWAVQGNWLAFAMATIVWISLIWGVFNLLPIGGLDGSHVLAELLERTMPGRGRKIAAYIGMATAVAVALWAFSADLLFLGLIVLFFAYQDFSRVTGAAR